MKRFIAVFVCSILLGFACFGESLWSSNETIKSANGKYLARIAESPSGTKKLEVYQRESNQLLWEKNIDWDERFRCLLSDDATVFALVNDVYSDAQYLVLVYTRDGQAGYSVKQIRLGIEDLMLRDGKKIWIDLEADSVGFVYDARAIAQYLDLKIINGKTLEISLR